MRIVILLMIISLNGACAEVIRGPRVVHYNPDWFYIRHAPTESRSQIDLLASGECADLGKSAQLETSYQLYPFDLRDAIYRCRSEGADTSASGAPGAGTQTRNNG